MKMPAFFRPLLAAAVLGAAALAVPAVASGDEPPPAPGGKLTYMQECPEADGLNTWRIINDTGATWEYTWDTTAGFSGGPITVASGGVEFFTSPKQPDTARIFIDGQLIRTKAGGNDKCVDVQVRTYDDQPPLINDPEASVWQEVQGDPGLSPRECTLTGKGQDEDGLTRVTGPNGFTTFRDLPRLGSGESYTVTCKPLASDVVATGDDVQIGGNAKRILTNGTELTVGPEDFSPRGTQNKPQAWAQFGWPQDDTVTVITGSIERGGETQTENLPGGGTIGLGFPSEQDPGCLINKGSDTTYVVNYDPDPIAPLIGDKIAIETTFPSQSVIGPCLFTIELLNVPVTQDTSIEIDFDSLGGLFGDQDILGCGSDGPDPSLLSGNDKLWCQISSSYDGIAQKKDFLITGYNDPFKKFR